MPFPESCPFPFPLLLSLDDLTIFSIEPSLIDALVFLTYGLLGDIEKPFPDESFLPLFPGALEAPLPFETGGGIAFGLPVDS